EADDAVHLVAFRGQHHHGNLRGRAQAAAQAQSVLSRQHDVEHDEIDAAGLDSVVHRAAIDRVRHPAVVIAQIARDQPADVAVVFDDEDVRRFGHRAILRITRSAPTRTKLFLNVSRAVTANNRNKPAPRRQYLINRVGAYWTASKFVPASPRRAS